MILPERSYLSKCHFSDLLPLLMPDFPRAEASSKELPPYAVPRLRLFGAHEPSCAAQLAQELGFGCFTQKSLGKIMKGRHR